jgi:hypothetical protein
MDHDTTTDITALESEVNAMEAAWAGQQARLDALLARTTPQPVDDTTAALRRLQRTARHTARLSALVEQQQSALAAELDAMEAGQ